MSSNKRRKLEEGQGTPKSAISALSARRKLAAEVAARDVSPPLEDEPKPRAGNQFSVLQRLAQASPKSPGTPKGASGRKDGASKRGSTDKGAETPDSGSSTPRIVPYSSFKLTKQNHRRKPNGVTELRLADSERFIVLGSFGIRVRAGEVAVLGATLPASETIHWIHAPHCHGLPVIRTCAEKNYLELHNDHATQPLMCLSALSPLYQRIWHESSTGDAESGDSAEHTFKILFTSEDAPKRSIIQELNSPPEWNKAISDLTSPSEPSQRSPLSVLVCGPKSAGKSTFSKLLTNRIVTSSSASQPAPGVAVIDLDPGQPEYAPAGTLSLIHITKPNLGTPFSHPGLQQAGHMVMRCHTLASVSPASSPSLYIQCATDLFETYRRTLRNCPLIVNTPGWILGTGLDLLVELITKIMPSQVVYMSEEGPVDVVDILRATTRKIFLTLPSQPTEYSARTSAHLRAMQTMSYFHLAEHHDKTAPATPSWNPQPITAIPPWEVRYAGKRSGIRGILSYDYQAPPELFASAINGMIVAVVEIEDAQGFRDIVSSYDGLILPEQELANEEFAEAADVSTTSTANEPRVVFSSEGLPMISNTNDATLDPRYCRTIGLALVRGIDTASKKLQLVTPIPLSQIQAAKSQGHDLVLVNGKFDAPTWAYAEEYFFQRTSSATSSDQKGDGKDLGVSYEDASDDEMGSSAAAADQGSDEAKDVPAVPWLEVLQGNQKRPVGSAPWRVRRDLGRGTGD